MTAAPTLPPVRRATAHGGPRLLGGPGDLRAHLGRLGPLPATGTGLVRAAHDAGLTGRGGAGFPTARKLAAVAAARAGRVVIGNGAEGEPLSAKDRTLLTHAPHLVLDGLDAAAAAVGGARRILAFERDDPAVERSVAAALAERGDDGVELVRTPRRYVSGQETALVDLVDGGAGRPTRHRPHERGVGGRPTLVDNVETLAHLALIARFGPVWYRQAGTADDPGTTLVTVGGAVGAPGVREVPRGTPLAAILGGAGAGADARAVLVGGYYGRWVPGEVALGLTFDRAGLAGAGAAPGAGVLAVVDGGSCAVAELARVAAWFAASSARQCGACTWGLADLAGAAAAVAGSSPDARALADIHRWTGMVRGRGGCRLPDGAVGFLESGLEVFAAEVEEHRAGRCRRPDRHLLPTPTPEPWS